MEFPKNVAIQCDTYKQVKAIKKLFGILMPNVKNAFRNSKESRYITSFCSGVVYYLYPLRTLKDYKIKIIHANEYLKTKLKDLTASDAVSCPTYEDVLILKGLAYDAGFDVDNGIYGIKDFTGKNYCIFPADQTQSDYKYASKNFKIHKLSKLIKTNKMKTPTKENIQKVYDKLVKEDCKIGIEAFKTLYPWLKEKKLLDRISFVKEGAEKVVYIDDEVAMWVSGNDEHIKLSSDFNWEFSEKDCGYYKLIPTKK